MYRAKRTMYSIKDVFLKKEAERVSESENFTNIGPVSAVPQPSSAKCAQQPSHSYAVSEIRARGPSPEPGSRPAGSPREATPRRSLGGLAWSRPPQSMADVVAGRGHARSRLAALSIACLAHSVGALDVRADSLRSLLCCNGGMTRTPGVSGPTQGQA
jgi:hypothetical protein